MSRALKYPGTLVCFEGGDAAGKTTLAQTVAEVLQARGLDPVLIDKKSAEGFTGPYLGERMKVLREVLWDYPPDAPLGDWGDHHWFHLLVAWFSVLDRCRVQPLLQEGRFVILDSWYYKFAARFLIKPDFGRELVLAGFSHLSVPDLVFFVDVAPEVAVTRRESFSATESGRLDGHHGEGASGFVSYQSRVLAELRTFCDTGWFRCDATHLTADALVEVAADVIVGFLFGGTPPGATPS